MKPATGTEVRRWIANKYGAPTGSVIITDAVAANYNQNHPQRPYNGPVKARADARYARQAAFNSQRSYS